MKNQCSEESCELASFGRGLCSKHYQLARYHGRLPSERGPKVCERCGETFEARKWNARYCSRTCNERARYENSRRPEFVAQNCQNCGVALPEDRRADTRYCSVKCGSDYVNGRRAVERQVLKVATRRPCQGCQGDIPEDRQVNALYCSHECKVRAKRHEAYGLTLVELQQLLDQHKQCAICGSTNWGKKGPQVDHDHATGAVRGVLCFWCNTGIGHLGDDPARLRAAARYIERREWTDGRTARVAVPGEVAQR